MNTVHIRCGNDIKHNLSKLDKKAHFIEFSDPLCHGPINYFSIDNIASRAHFVSSSYELSFKEVEQKMISEYSSLDQLADYDRIVLWFEHDHYDQMILFYLMDFFSKQQNLPILELICIDNFRGVDRFIGLGQLDIDQLKDLWDNQRKQVSKEAIQTGSNIWHAIINRDWDLSSIDSKLVQGYFPFAVRAIKRYVQDYPVDDKALPLTYKYTLEMLSDGLERDADELFRVLNNSKELLPFLGDLMYWYLLREMSNDQLISIEQNKQFFHKSKIKITNVGIEKLKANELASK